MPEAYLHLSNLHFDGSKKKEPARAFGRDRDNVMQNLRTANPTEEQIEKIAPHRTFEGNQPTNSFDQWGVELRKNFSGQSCGSLRKKGWVTMIVQPRD